MDYILNFIRKYWLFFVLICSLGVLLIKLNDVKNLLNMTKKTYQNKIEQLEKIYIDEMSERDKIIRQYEKDLNETELKYEDAVADLMKERLSKKKFLIKESSDSEKLSKRIIDLYGFSYFKIDN